MRQADSKRGDRLQLNPVLDTAEPVPVGRRRKASALAQEDLAGGVAAHSLSGSLPISEQPPANRRRGHFSPCKLRLTIDTEGVNTFMGFGLRTPNSSRSSRQSIRALASSLIFAGSSPNTSVMMSIALLLRSIKYRSNRYSRSLQRFGAPLKLGEREI